MPPKNKKIVIYTTDWCGLCDFAIEILDKAKLPYTKLPTKQVSMKHLKIIRENQWKKIPAIFIDDQLIGGYFELEDLYNKGRLKT